MLRGFKLHQISPLVQHNLLYKGFLYVQHANELSIY